MFSINKVEVVLSICFVFLAFVLLGKIGGVIILSSCILGIILCSAAVFLADILLVICNFISRLFHLGSTGTSVLDSSKTESHEKNQISHEINDFSFVPLAKMVVLFAGFNYIFGSHDFHQNYSHHIFDDVSDCHGGID